MDNILLVATLILFVIVSIAWAYARWLDFAEADLHDRIAVIGQFVAAAEQLLGGQSGKTRYQWVMERIQKRWPDADLEEMAIYVEAAVHRLKSFDVSVDED